MQDKLLSQSAELGCWSTLYAATQPELAGAPWGVQRLCGGSSVGALMRHVLLARTRGAPAPAPLPACCLRQPLVAWSEPQPL